MVAVLCLPAVKTTDDPADPINRLMHWTGGDVLRVGDMSDGGENDHFRAGLVSTKDRRRLGAAHLISSVGGLRADELQHALAVYAPIVAGMNADVCVEWYVSECLAGLRYRALRRDRVTPWHERERPDDDEPAGCDSLGADDDLSCPGAPGWVVAWVLRTVHVPKARYIVAIARWRWGGGALPDLPCDSHGTPYSWAVPVLTKYSNRGVEVE